MLDVRCRTISTQDERRTLILSYAERGVGLRRRSFYDALNANIRLRFKAIAVNCRNGWQLSARARRGGARSSLLRGGSGSNQREKEGPNSW